MIKRYPGETRKSYRARQKEERKEQRILTSGRWFFKSVRFLGKNEKLDDKTMKDNMGTYRRSEWDENGKFIGGPREKKDRGKASVKLKLGKRKPGESLEKFRKRRKIANAKRRQREMAHA